MSIAKPSKCLANLRIEAVLQLVFEINTISDLIGWQGWEDRMICDAFRAACGYYCSGDHARDNFSRCTIGKSGELYCVTGSHCNLHRTKNVWEKQTNRCLLNVDFAAVSRLAVAEVTEEFDDTHV